MTQCNRKREDLSLLLSPIKRYKIKTKRATVEPFRLNPAQELVLSHIIEKWEAGQRVRTVIIKGRQQGISTFMQLLMLALVMKLKSYSCYTMAHNSDSAKDLFENKIKFAFDQFPEAFKTFYKVKRDNVRQLQFEGEMQGSVITVGTSARSTTQNFIHISEPGKMSMKTDLWQEMISGTLPAGEEADAIIFESTPDGGLGPFYELVKSGAYDVLFLAWYLQEEYQSVPPEDVGWKAEYQRLASLYKLDPDIQDHFNLTDNQLFWYYSKAKELGYEVKVQYPSTVQEGFIAASDSYFDVNWVESQMDRVRSVTFTDSQGVRIYHKPKRGEKYSIGVDTSTGEGADPAVITVVDSKGLEVAVWSKKADDDLITTVLFNLAKYYNTAAIGIEITDTGRVVLRKLRYDYQYPVHLLYRDLAKAEKVKSRNSVFGWFTTGKSRPRLLGDLRSALYNGEITINSKELLDELMHFILIDGKYQAAPSTHDDRIFSIAIAYQVRMFREYTLV